MNIRNFFVGRTIGFLAVLLVVGAVATIISLDKAKTTAQSPKDASYLIEGKLVRIEGSVHYFGNDLVTDLDGDGREDVVFLITQDGGGSGTFYYVVAALNTTEGYKGSDGYFLGDRIAPQTINNSPNPRHKYVIVVNYADRKVTEPMTAQPSVGKSVYLKIDSSNTRWGIVEPDFEGESI